MKQRGRRNSKVTAAEVVDLVSDSNSDAKEPPAQPSRRRSKERAAAAAAAAAIAGSIEAAARDACADDEFIDSDFELEDEPQPQQQRAVAGGGRKRTLAATQPVLGSLKAPKSGLSAGSGAAKDSAKSPAAKRAKTGAAAAGAGVKGGSSKVPHGAGSKAARNKQAAAKGFSALFLHASQHTGGSQGSADAGGSQQHTVASAAAALQLTASIAAAEDGPSTTTAAAAAAAGGADTAAAGGPAELWVDKYTPRSIADLVVHKKKVQEVQDWLTFYQEHKSRHHTRAVLVTGPPGCGKSLTVRVVAASLGFEVMEWTPPVPTLWADHQYMAGAGVHYSSKLDDFDMFVARCKFAALPLSSPQAPTQQQQQHLLPQQPLQTQSQTQQNRQQKTQQQQPQQTQAQTQQTQVPTQQQQQQQQQKATPKQRLILVEDLPHVHDAERRGRLAAALAELATTARCPVVLLATTEEGAGGRGVGQYGGAAAAAAAGMTTKGLHKDFVSVLEQCGCGSISFNPITGPTLAKALAAIAEAEGYSLEQGLAQGLVAGAGGDLRNGIQNLQMLLQGPGAVRLQPGKKGKGSKTQRKPRKGKADAGATAAAAAASDALQAGVTAQISRDLGLSVFHTIGKLLHYKRNPDGDKAAAAGGQQQQQGVGDEEDHSMEGGEAGMSQEGRPPVSQPPLRIDPESILSRSGLEALQVTAFLAENYTHFMADDALGEAAEAATHLSDAAYMCCHRNTSAPSVAFWDEGDPNAGSLASAAAVSVAARGLLWANRWLPLKGPSCFMPERAAATNMVRLDQALQALQDQAAASSSSSRQEVMGLAGQLLHAGRQDRAAQVLPYLQTLGRAPSRLWLYALLPRSWCYMWGGSITERPSPALQGPGAAAAVAAALQAAAAAAAAAGGRGPSGVGGQGLVVGQPSGGLVGGGGGEEVGGGEDPSEEIEDESSDG